MISRLIVALIVALGIGTGVALLRKKREKSDTNHDLDSNPNHENIQSIDKIYETLLETDFLPNSSSVLEKPKYVEVELKNKTFWKINGSLIVSGIVIIVFAATMSMVSIFSQRAYSSRKAVEEQQSVLEQVKKTEVQWERDSLQVKNLYNRLDSMDVHIKSLKPTKPVQSKKKGK